MKSNVTPARFPALLLALAVALTTVSSCSSGGGSSGAPTNPGTTSGLELNSGDFGRGGTYQHRFFAAGTFPYHCIHHSPMTGSVTVSASAADTLVNVSIVSDTAPFPPASVKPGGRVIWTNNNSMVHTVTSN